MKNISFVFFLCAFSTSISAQFKVQSDGKIAMQTTSTALSPISINGTGDASFYMHGNAVGTSGLYFKADVSTTNVTNLYGGYFNAERGTNSIGVYGGAALASNSIGVFGHANMGTKLIGVLGNISYITTGAGVYGTIYGDKGSALNSGDIYAGFFYGNVKTTGTLTVGTTIQGALLGESSSEISTDYGEQSVSSSSISDCLTGLNVTTYQKERPVLPEDIEFIDANHEEGGRQSEKPKDDIICDQFYDKKHFALDADRLEETFPDLVYMKPDGSKAINYMEMIPLLVQSINELNAEISTLKGLTPGTSAKKSRAAATDIATEISQQNKLYQNTPNPFKETTTIRFSLADNAKNAAICIFDMTGKMLKKLSVSSDMTSVSISGYELGEGMFLYTLMVNGQEVDTKRMILSK